MCPALRPCWWWSRQNVGKAEQSYRRFCPAAQHDTWVFMLKAARFVESWTCCPALFSVPKRSSSQEIRGMRYVLITAGDAVRLTHPGGYSLIQPTSRWFLSTRRLRYECRGDWEPNSTKAPLGPSTRSATSSRRPPNPTLKTHPLHFGIDIQHRNSITAQKQKNMRSFRS